jgi:hypothetical protein
MTEYIDTAETRREQREFVDSIWPIIKREIDSSMFDLETDTVGVEMALKLAADIAILKWESRNG